MQMSKEADDADTKRSFSFRTRNYFLMGFKIKISFKWLTDKETAKQGEIVGFRHHFLEISEHLLQMEMLT